MDHAFERNGHTSELVKKLSKGNILAQMLPFVKGLAEINIVKHIIDCDADPFIPDGWSVEEHKKGEKFEWSFEKVKFYLSKSQQKGEPIEGNKLRKELESKPVLNADVLDYLLKNPRLIPEDWKKDENENTHYIFFWGTIYRDSGGDLCVRCLYWHDGRWHWSSHWLAYDWDGSYPALLLAS